MNQHKVITKSIRVEPQVLKLNYASLPIGLHCLFPHIQCHYSIPSKLCKLRPYFPGIFVSLFSHTKMQRFRNITIHSITETCLSWYLNNARTRYISFLICVFITNVSLCIYNFEDVICSYVCFIGCKPSLSTSSKYGLNLAFTLPAQAFTSGFDI